MTSSKRAKGQADDCLIYESLTTDLQSDDSEDHFDCGRRGLRYTVYFALTSSSSKLR